MRRAQRHLLWNWIDQYATRILAVSEAAMSSAWKADWGSDPRCMVLYNGLNPRPFWAAYNRQEILREFGWPSETRLWIHVGNFREAKNHAKLVSIFSLLATADSRARLLLVGRADNSWAMSLRQRIENLGIQNKIVMCGVRSDVPRLLSAADGMIFPSLREGLPGAVLEACAAGVPVLASDLPGIIEIARHFPSVECLPCDASDEHWAQRASLLPERRLRNAVAVETARTAFARSPFEIQTCVGLHGQIWGSDAASPEKAAA
jgi:glycosyltransferase involved in cell wall biosynthesis